MVIIKYYISGNRSNVQFQFNKYFQQNRPKINIDLRNIIRSSIPLHLDVAVFVEKETLDLLKNKGKPYENYFKQIFNHAAQIFAWHRIYIHVRKIEYWSNGDKIRNKIPFDFESYKSYIFSQQYIFDSYIVFTNIKREGLAGMALIGTVCSRSSIAFVDGGNRSRFNEKTVAETLAHELGHSFGFDHVESRETHNCACHITEPNYCIMHAAVYPWEGDGSKSFENCRITQLLNNIHKYQCFLSTINNLPRLFTACGDAVVDKNEECDSGFNYIDQISIKSKPCCNMTTCKFTERQHQCSFGQCCENCMLTKQKICRTSTGECDVTEYCDGKNHECPKDVIKKNFEFCNYETSFCYNGVCTNPTSLCRYVFKDDNVYFSQSCVYAVANMLTEGCERKTETIKKHVCGEYSDVCQNFICANTQYNFEYMFLFYNKGEFCMLPNESVRHGIFKKGLDFIKCSMHEDSYCHQGTCINDKKLLRNCKDGRCTNFYNNYIRPINKLY